jgi:acetyl-CoA carboxylase carboxyl transferase subunit alpha
MYNYLDFEKPVADLEGKIIELKKLAESGEAVDVGDEIAAGEALEGSAPRCLPRADPVAEGAGRPPSRPAALRRLPARLFTDFTPLAGDRAFGEDHAIVGGFARFRGEPVAVLGQEKGSDTKTRLKHNFGMAKPEGYRKAVRIMELADRFGVPVVSSSTPPAPIPASAPRSAARPRRSPARPRAAWR